MSNAYQHPFTENGNWKPSINGLSFESLTREEARCLESPFSEEEIFSVLSALKGDKAPVLRGLSWLFGIVVGTLSRVRCWASLRNFMILGILKGA